MSSGNIPLPNFDAGVSSLSSLVGALERQATNGVEDAVGKLSDAIGKFFETYPEPIVYAAKMIKPQTVIQVQNHVSKNNVNETV